MFFLKRLSRAFAGPPTRKQLLVRIESFEAAVEAQRKRIAALMTERDDALYGEAAANRIAEGLRKELAEARKLPAPLAYTELHKRTLATRGVTSADMVEAVAALASDSSLQAMNGALSPTISDAETKWYLGMAEGLRLFRQRLAQATTPEKKP